MEETVLGRGCDHGSLGGAEDEGCVCNGLMKCSGISRDCNAQWSVGVTDLWHSNSNTHRILRWRDPAAIISFLRSFLPFSHFFFLCPFQVPVLPRCFCRASLPSFCLSLTPHAADPPLPFFSSVPIVHNRVGTNGLQSRLGARTLLSIRAQGIFLFSLST